MSLSAAVRTLHSRRNILMSPSLFSHLKKLVLLNFPYEGGCERALPLWLEESRGAVPCWWEQTPTCLNSCFPLSNRPHDRWVINLPSLWQLFWLIPAFTAFKAAGRVPLGCKLIDRHRDISPMPEHLRFLLSSLSHPKHVDTATSGNGSKTIPFSLIRIVSLNAWGVEDG